MRVLVVNAGSSSLKLRVVEADDAISWSRDLPPDAPIDLGGLPDVEAVGHRVVHGGRRFTEPVCLTPEAIEHIEALVHLAPLHQPKSLEALRAVADLLPHLPAVACFDTAFHQTLPDAAATYAIPREWRERFGIRKYGFHGLSHAWAARAAEAGRVITCHLGAGASLAAVRDGRCVDTTMGFTPMAGLVMATRSGDVDPGALMWLLEHMGVSPDAMAEALDHQSGLLALSGTADMREVIAADDPLGFEVYVHRLAAGIAAMAAALGGLDALVFTGGVGERAPRIRAVAATRLEFLGVRVDEQRNGTAVPDADIGAGPVRVLVVESREDLEIARGVREALGSAGATVPAA